MKNKNAFTLVELLSVIVILGITFIFVIPSLTELFTMGNKTETELIEEKVLSAAKEYVNKIDGTFYTKLYKEGDTNYIYKSDLINAGLITNEEISKLNTFAGVKGEVLKNDRIRYTVEYINASNNEYTNEELYLMMQNMNKNIENLQSANSTETNSLKNRIEELENITSNMSVLKSYPVGSIYISENSTSPEELFGGEWEQLKDRFLLGTGDTYTAGITGGEATHTLTINEMPNHNHSLYGHTFNWGVGSGLNYPVTASDFSAYAGYPTNNALVTDQNRWSVSSFAGGSQPHNNMPPYVTVYMWKRTA